MGAGLGSALGGASQGFGKGLDYSQVLQDEQAQSTIGAAARQLSGAPAAKPQGLGSLFGGMGDGQQQQQTPPQMAQSAPPPPQQPPTGIARAPIAAPPPGAPIPQTSQPIAQPPPISRPQMPPSQAIPPGQPGTANASAPPAVAPQQPPQPQPGPGTAALAQQTQQPPQAQQQPQIKPNPQASGEGVWTLPSLTRAIVKAQPNISDKALGRALFRASPLLNQEGLQAYRGMGQQLMVERANTALERLGIERDREGRLEKGAANKPRIDQATKEASAIRGAAKAEYEAVMNKIPPATPEERQKAEQKFEAEQKRADETLSKGYAPSEEDTGGSEHPIVYDDKGRAMRWNGKGDSKDPKNYDPVQ